MFQKRSKKMFLHWRANLADQNKQQPLKINIHVTYHTVLSVWNKPLIDTCQHCSTNRANQALRSLANAGFQNRGVCLQAFPSFPSPPPHFNFLALVSFLARPKPRIPFLGLSLLRNQTETLATQAKIAIGISIKNILRVVFAPSPPYPTVFSCIHLRNCFLPLSSGHTWRKNHQLMHHLKS